MARARTRLAADERAVARAMGWVERFCNLHQLSRAVTDVVCLSLEEVVSNIVEHGYERQPGRLSIELHYDRRALSVVLAESSLWRTIPHVLVQRMPPLGAGSVCSI